MIQVFLSYARADGLEAATKLRAELAAMGFAVWRDIEEMRGGLAWKKQLHQALAAVDAVLVLLTPGAVASPTVTWEWQTVLVMEKRLIPLRIIPCDVPAELQRLHYHSLHDPTTYTLGLSKLARDLMALGREKGQPTPGTG
ncbi:MAG: toll/interleukin-1 receptor domain-containing protein [Anaerolineae bacterium]